MTGAESATPAMPAPSGPIPPGMVLQVEGLSLAYPAQRGRPLVGVPVLYGLVPEGPGRWSGRLYNIDNGNSYSGRLLELGPTTIRVEGCAIGICGGQNMSRIK